MNVYFVLKQVFLMCTLMTHYLSRINSATPTQVSCYTVYDDSPSFSSVVHGCQPIINYHDRRIALDNPGDDIISDILRPLRSIYGDIPIVVNYYDWRSGYCDYDRSPDLLSIAPNAISDQTTSVTVNYYDSRSNHPGDDTILLSNVLGFIRDPIEVNYYRCYFESDDNILLNSSLIPSLQHVSHTFIPANYITERQSTSNVIVPGQLANNNPIPRQQLANHITVAGQQLASHIVASGQQTASHIIVPGHPPVIGHKKRGHK
ncbi:27067_t:CDS:2, partial [Gigaspora margarita]